ncbi:hypothetical protein IRJ41_009793 [Triplophysa rosa]|uniref:Uncharacterized protein n=1 Tax=Triplophysa rosa TaxID=992332 RepID=A0A9W7WJP1_TRIRA|nr:hypothetical protein IRJ41_009793 [Triplophysa rosa]
MKEGEGGVKRDEEKREGRQVRSDKRRDPTASWRVYPGLTGKHGCGFLSEAATDLSPAVMASALTPCRKQPS